MAGESRRQLILEALRTRAAEIEIANGFQTDVGKRLYFGEVPNLGPHDSNQALAIIPMEDQIGELQLGNLSILLPVNFVALAKPTLSEPWVIVEQVIADIKKAIELEDRTLGGLLTGGRNNPEGLIRGTTEVAVRQSGSDAVGAMVTYVCHYAEAWGHPEA